MKLNYKCKIEIEITGANDVKMSDAVDSVEKYSEVLKTAIENSNQNAKAKISDVHWEIGVTSDEKRN